MPDFDNVPDIDLPARLRRDIEMRVRNIVPDTGNKDADKLSNKVKGLDRLNRNELNAFFSFNTPANEHIHGKTHISQAERQRLLSDYNTVVNALDKRYGKSSGFDGSQWLGNAIVAIIVAVFVIWLAMNFVLPLLEMVSVVLICVTAFVFKKHRHWVMAIALLAFAFVFSRYDTAWYSFGVVSYFPGIVYNYKYFFAANVLAAAIAAYILIGAAFKMVLQKSLQPKSAPGIIVLLTLGAVSAFMLYNAFTKMQ